MTPRRLRIFNGYGGVGGNRRDWGDDHDITMVELNPEIADVYQQLYPGDQVIVGDAHQYLLENMHRFDFVWVSPVCKTHSVPRHIRVKGGQLERQYPDLRLYEEVLALQEYATGGWVVENVVPYYNQGRPLVPATRIGRHLYWSNFEIPSWTTPMDDVKHRNVAELEAHLGIDLSPFDLRNKREVLRNCVTPEVGRYILDTFLGTSTHRPTGGLLDAVWRS